MQHPGMHIFDALADPVRRRLVDILASGEHTSGQLAEVVGHEFRIGRTAVSKHLRLLRDARLVDVRADERWRWYHLSSDGVRMLELELDDLRFKRDRAVGWDAEHHREHDPLAWRTTAPAVPFKGPGRARRAGQRGRQASIPIAPDPERGLCPIPPLTDPPDVAPIRLPQPRAGDG